MQQTKKVDSILAEYSEETFEFAPVRQIDANRFVSNCQNHSHDDGEAHIYPVFFDVAQDGTVIGAHVAECGCPADEYHDGACKHRGAASECGELLGAVLKAALATGDDVEEEKDSAAVDGEKEQSGRTAIADGGRAVGEWANRGGMPCPERMSAAIELVCRWAIEYDEAKEFLRGVGFLEGGDGGEKKLVTDSGTDVPHDCPNEPERRNIHGEPICDECGMVVVDRENSDFGGGCLCQGCQDGFRREMESEFGEELVTDGGQSVEHTLSVGDRYGGTHGHVWQIDAFGVEQEIFQRTEECVEVSCPETRDRSWIPEEQFVESLNDPESAICLIDAIEKCECCEQRQLVHSEQEVTLP